MPLPQNSEIQYKASAGTFNLDEAQGIVECFVAGIGNKDSVGDICATGAFSKSLLRRKPRVVWGHNWNDPIGKVLDIYEVPASDSRLPMKMKMAGIGGLYAKVQFNLQSEKGREAFANVAFFGEEQEWSIGYKTLRAQYDQNMQANVLHEVELYEVSPVLHGANQLTGTISVKTDGMYSDVMERVATSLEPMQEAINVRLSGPTAQTDNLDEDLSQKIANELEKRTASKIKILSLDKNSVIFNRQTSDGVSSKYKCGYHYDGREFMFGQPQRMVVQKPNTNPPSMSPQQEAPARLNQVVKPVPMMPMPVAIRPGENGPMSVPLPVVVYEGVSRNKPNTDEAKPQDMGSLDNEERALADALVRITGKYGKFNEDKKGVYAAYTPAAENDLVDIGVKCSNCVFFKGNGVCKIIDKAVEADGRCRFAVIPPGVVNGNAFVKKEYNDFLDEEEVKWVEDIEEKYPSEFILGGLRNIVKKRGKKRRKYKALDEFDAEEYAIKEKTLGSEKEKFFVIPVSAEYAFEAKSLLDPILDYHRVDSFVDEYGIVLTSGITDKFIDAVDVAVKAIGSRLGRSIGSRAIDRPNIGKDRRKLGTGRIDIPTAGVRGSKKPTGSRLDIDGDGWSDEGSTNPVWVGLRSGANKPKQRTPIWERNRRPSPPVPSRLRELSDDKKPESRRTPPPSPSKPKPTKTPSSPPIPPRKKGKLSSGKDNDNAFLLKATMDKDTDAFFEGKHNGRDVSRHVSREQQKFQKGNSKELEARRRHEAVADKWIEEGAGWETIDWNSLYKYESPDYIRGLELGLNQSREKWNGWDGKSFGRRPPDFNPKQTGGVVYSNWYRSYLQEMGSHLKAIQMTEDNDMRRGIEEMLSSEIKRYLPNTDLWERADSEALNRAIRDAGFTPNGMTVKKEREIAEKAKKRGLSSGRKLSSGAKTQIAENNEKIAELTEEIDRQMLLAISPSGRGDAAFQNFLRRNLLDMSQELRLLEGKKKRLETESRRSSKKKNVKVPFPEVKPKRESQTQRENRKIYERRDAGESLADVAKSLGISREEVRKREQRHMRRMRQEEGERLSEDANRPGEKLSSGLLPISEALRRSEPPDFTPEDKQKIMMRVRDTPEYQDLREIQEILDGYIAKGRTRASMPDLDKREIAANRALQDRRDYIIEQMITRGEITRPKRSEDSNRSGEGLSSGKSDPIDEAINKPSKPLKIAEYGAEEWQDFNTSRDNDPQQTFDARVSDDMSSHEDGSKLVGHTVTFADGRRGVVVAGTEPEYRVDKDDEYPDSYNFDKVGSIKIAVTHDKDGNRLDDIKYEKAEFDLEADIPVATRGEPLGSPDNGNFVQVDDNKVSLDEVKKLSSGSKKTRKGEGKLSSGKKLTADDIDDATVNSLNEWVTKKEIYDATYGEPSEEDFNDYARGFVDGGPNATDEDINNFYDDAEFTDQDYADFINGLKDDERKKLDEDIRIERQRELKNAKKLSSGKKDKKPKRQPFSPDDRQRFADGDRLKARTIPAKKKPGPSIEEFRLSSGYGGGSRLDRRKEQLSREEREDAAAQISQEIKQGAISSLKNIKKTPSFDTAYEKDSNLAKIQSKLKAAFKMPALVGSTNDNKNRKPDGPWMLDFGKFRRFLNNENGEPMSDLQIKQVFNLDDEELKKLLGKNGAISSAAVQSFLASHGPDDEFGEGLIRKIWGFDSAPYWYDSVEDNRLMNREEYDAASDESNFMANVFGLENPIDYQGDDLGPAPSSRAIITPEASREAIEGTKGEESSEAYSFDKLLSNLGLSGKSPEEVAQSFEKLLGEKPTEAQMFKEQKSWAKRGVPTDVVLELKKRGHIESASSVFGSKEADALDVAVDQDKFFTALNTLLKSNGINLGRSDGARGGIPKGSLSDATIGRILADAIGQEKPISKVGRAFSAAESDKPFSYRRGRAIVWTPDEIQRALDGINKKIGKDFKTTDLKLSSGKFGKGERKINPNLSSRGQKKNPLDKIDDGKRLSSGKLDEVYKSITQKLITAIEGADGDKWEAPWYKVGAFPKNPTNKNRPYSNTNLLFLLMAQEEKGYKNPYWATYKQWDKSGGQVRAGEKGTKILVPRIYKGKEDADGSKKEGGVFYSVATVFNSDQVEGIDLAEIEDKFPKLSEEQRVSQLESAIKEIGAKITEATSDRAYYSPTKDEIVLPRFQNFKSPLDFYATQAHELMHWTGHSSRMNRPNMNYFGSPEYAYEELVAEIAAAFFMAAHGLSAEPQPQHAQYLASWLKRLKSDPDALQKAVSDAQKAVNFAIRLSPSMSKRMAVSENVDDVPGVTIPDIDAKLSSGKASSLPALSKLLKENKFSNEISETTIDEALSLWRDNPGLHKSYIERLDGDIAGAVFSLYDDYLMDMDERTPKGAARRAAELDEQFRTETRLSSGKPSKMSTTRANSDRQTRLSSGLNPENLTQEEQKKIIAAASKLTWSDFAKSVVSQYQKNGKLSPKQWDKMIQMTSKTLGTEGESTTKKSVTGGEIKPFSGIKRKEIDISDVKAYDYPTVDSSGKKKPPPTPEQSDAIDAMMTGSDVKVAALAATGKTTTVISFANRLLEQEPESRILYLVFNRNAKNDVIKRGMPENVEVKTMDGVAFQAMAASSPEMTAKSFNPEISPIKSNKDRAKYLGARQLVSKGEELTAVDVYRRVVKAVEHYAISNDKEIGAQHFQGQFNGKLAVNDENIIPELVSLAKKYWKDATTPRDGKVGMLPINNGHVTKMWALSNPDIGLSESVNIAMIDEAQDMNPVFAGILRNAKNTQRIYVGDVNQAINAWRGADGTTLIDASAKYSMPITDSFRFGQNIAGMGNRFLSLLGVKERMRGRKTDKSGNPVDGIVDSIDNPTMILTRSNGGAIAATMSSFEKGLKVYGSKNFKEDLEKFINNIEFMTKGYYTDSRTGEKKRSRPSMSEDLDGIVSLQQFNEAIEKKDNNRLNMLGKLLDEYGVDELRAASNRIITDEKKLPKNRDEYVHIQTVHTSKGLESPRVKIWTDFRGPKKSELGDGDWIMPNEQELRLSYVAVTRAEEELELGSLDWITKHTSDDDGAPNKLSSGRGMVSEAMVRTLARSQLRKDRKRWDTQRTQRTNSTPNRTITAGLSSGRAPDKNGLASSLSSKDRIELIGWANGKGSWSNFAKNLAEQYKRTGKLTSSQWIRLSELYDDSIKKR